MSFGLAEVQKGEARLVQSLTPGLDSTWLVVNPLANAVGTDQDVMGATVLGQ